MCRKEAQRRIDAYRYNEADGAMDPDLVRHIEHCPTCRNELGAKQEIACDMQKIAAESLAGTAA